MSLKHASASHRAARRCQRRRARLCWGAVVAAPRTGTGSRKGRCTATASRSCRTATCATTGGEGCTATSQRCRATEASSARGAATTAGAGTSCAGSPAAPPSSGACPTTAAPSAGTGGESRPTTAAGPGTDESGPKAGEYDRRVDRVTLDEIKVPVANDPTWPTYQCIWAATFGPGERSPPSSGY